MPRPGPSTDLCYVCLVIASFDNNPIYNQFLAKLKIEGSLG